MCLVYAVEQSKQGVFFFCLEAQAGKPKRLLIGEQPAPTVVRRAWREQLQAGASAELLAALRKALPLPGPSG